MNVLTMPLHLARLGSSQVTTLPHDGLIKTLTQICVSVNVAASVTFWSDYKPFGQMQFPFLMMEVSVVFSHRDRRAFAHFLWLSLLVPLAPRLFLRFFAPLSCGGPTFFMRIYRLQHC